MLYQRAFGFGKPQQRSMIRNSFLKKRKITCSGQCHQFYHSSSSSLFLLSSSLDRHVQSAHAINHFPFSSSSYTASLQQCTWYHTGRVTNPTTSNNPNNGQEQTNGKGTSPLPIKSATTSATNSTKLLQSTPNETTIGNNEDEKKDGGRPPPFIKLDPRAIFPWRHSTHPLPRLIPNSKEYMSEGGYMGPNMPPLNIVLRGLAWFNTTGFLGGSLSNYWSWKRDLEFGFMMAFVGGVQGVLMDVYCVSEKDKDKNNINNVDTHSNDSNDDDEIENNPIPSIHFNHQISPIAEDAIPADLQHDPTISQNTKDMLESNLISIYKSAHEHAKHKLQVNLQSTPTSATIMSLFTIPFVTRQEVIDKPALKHCFRDVAKRMKKEESQRGRGLNSIEMMRMGAYELDEMAKTQMRRRGDTMMQITIVAQVAILCDEIFQVVDVQTGETVQGDDSNRVMKDVSHLVRFEMVVDLDSETGGTELGSWQITDWDDILDGNIWYF